MEFKEYDMHSYLMAALGALAALFIASGDIYADAARDIAPLAVITASANQGMTIALVDGKIPFAGSRDDAGQVWVIGQDALPATITFKWNEPQIVHTLAYYGRTTWGLEVFNDYEVYGDDGEEAVVTGSFVPGHGPQLVEMPETLSVQKLTLKLLSGSGYPGTAEIQIFTAAPSQDDLFCYFTDLSLDFRYAYYPSHDLVRILLPEPPEGATHWHLVLTPYGGDEVLAEREGELPMNSAGENMEIPELPENDYLLTLTLTGGEEPLIEERGFRRRFFEWEGNELGKDDVVVPPFEPLTVSRNENMVTSVLREHTHGSTGLWQQVVSRGRPLLAEPVRLELISGGKTYVADGGGVEFATVKDTQVTGSAQWSAGPLDGSTEFRYDYDGMKLLTLHLAETDEEIERLQLVIPFKPDEAWLMHPVTIWLRQHYAGRIPGGDGKVWDSSSVPDRVNGNFVPYIYVGGPERGICFAADNDRDWIIDRDGTAMEIDRSGGAVNLRLNLIAHPAKLTRERQITFALQATPAKPMPEVPHNWRLWTATGTPQDIDDVFIFFWGGNMYWGGRHFATSLYPAFEDYSFYEELENRRKRQGNQEFFEKWMTKFDNLPHNERAYLAAHYQAGLGWAGGSPEITEETTKYGYVIPYTNARGTNGEHAGLFGAYLDEWMMADIADPRWHSLSDFQRPKRLAGGGCWYEVEPVESWVDKMLFYHKKMFDTFADGIYWDNFLLQSSCVPPEAGGPGYVDDGGNLRAGVNLMGLRNLAKRTATMMHQMGKRPLIYIHMTNTNVVPTLSFATLQLDWEWRDQRHYAAMDLQDRLHVGSDTGLILAQSLGLKSGNVNVAIDRFGPPPDSGVTREWLFRTVMAVCIPHEIKIHQGERDVRNVLTHLAKFGYGLPECKVYRYWEENYPLQMTGAINYALVLSREDKPRAMLAVGNFGPGEQPEAIEAHEAPTLGEYDAGQRGEGQETDVETQRNGDETYTVTLTLDLDALELPESVRAYNVELDGTELERVRPGVFKLTIRKHDFALILVE